MTAHLIRGEDFLASKEGFQLVGRRKELETLFSVLMRQRANSVLLNGPAGVGCTALCLGLVAATKDPKTPYDIVGKRIYWLDVDGMFADGDQQKLALAWNNVMAELKNTPESVLIIEDMGDFLDACRSSGNTYFINALFSAIKQNHTQVIFETHDGDLDSTLKCHSDAGEVLTLIDVTEPTGPELFSIVMHGAESLVKFHGIKIQPAALEKTIELTTKYRARLDKTRAQPDSSFALLDQALSSFRRSVHSNGETAEIKGYIEKLKAAETLYVKLKDSLRVEVEKSKEAAEKSDVAKSSALGRLAAAGRVESEYAAQLREKMISVLDEIKILKDTVDAHAQKINDSVILSATHILLEFARMTGLNADKLAEDEKEKLKSLEFNMKKDIFGQDPIVKAVANGVKTAKVGRRNRDAPLGAWMLLGPSGTGKTQMAKALAKNLFDDEKALFRLDMSEYMEKHAVAKLIGAPPGYEGFEAGGILTNGVRRNPSQIILFDEIEKAHPDVFNVLLQVLSDGRLTDNVGRVISFADCWIVMTTNIGQKFLLDDKLTDDEARVGALTELDSTYRSEFLNRFAGRKNIHCFSRLGLDSIERIVMRELVSVSTSYSSDAEIEVDGTMAKAVARDHYDARTGARGIPGFISTSLEPKIVEYILDNTTGDRIRLRVEYDEAIKDFVVKQRMRMAA